MPRQRPTDDVIFLEFTRVHPAAEAWRKVLHLGSRLHFPRGAEILFQGQSGQAIYFLEQGEVRMVRFSQEGREKILWSGGPGTLFGETPFFDETPQRSTFVAAKDCIARAFPRRVVLEQILPSQPDLVLALFRSLASKARVLSNQSASLSLEDLPSRICMFLHLRLGAAETANSSPRICPGLNQQELASLLGVHRVTLNKVLRDLEKDLILGPYSRDEVYILDLERFRQLAFKGA